MSTTHTTARPFEPERPSVDKQPELETVAQDDEKFYEKHVRILLPALIAQVGNLGHHSPAVMASILSIMQKTGSMPGYAPYDLAAEREKEQAALASEQDA